ncbi:hypothetical protein H310_07493 [Aphanomyces invadans]|uniref:Arsenate reductase n=1 Tax=Aphanomyces invadans TaxID=157072 RepID=A0A024U378_9STRA|nr:hypothetical protein H310_07493 [Aphanomyces invadans]ETW00063.1 hypothetical protein H310_07493 [Aphanomyces invadans]RHY19195.1 hypothetical protein DYB32_010272 [Aphanomyces invadans]|eukprot:XP_008871088.1 hypothetical protein H310_07493 [Aphanomyces invadans]
MPTATVYLNFGCGTCRKAHDLLTAYMADPTNPKLDLTIVEYVKTKLDVATIKSLLSLLFPEDPSPSPLLMMRTTSEEFRTLKLDALDPVADREALIEAMSVEPLLIARPIFVKDGRAIIARPHDRLYELLKADYTRDEPHPVDDYC